MVGDGVPWPAAQYQKLAEQLRKFDEKTQCQVCGKSVPVKMAIISKGGVLCEECYARRERSTKREDERH